MEEVRELVDGEEGYFHYINGDIGSDQKSDTNKITVDKDGFEHSIDDKPAYINYYGLSNKSIEIWYKHGREHRLTGPAYVCYGEYNILVSKGYWIEGKRLTQEEFETYINRYKLLNEI